MNIFKIIFQGNLKQTNKICGNFSLKMVKEELTIHSSFTSNQKKISVNNDELPLFEEL